MTFFQTSLVKQKGFTLLEILIAVLILSIGLLGFAALQISAVSSSQDGYFRSQALLVAESLADKIRANRDYVRWDSRADPVAAGFVADANLYGDNGGAGGTAYSCAAPAKLCTAAVCNQQELAAFDVFETCEDVDEVLPDGKVTVVCSDVDETLVAKPNPYIGLNHPNFLGTPEIILVAEIDNDNCSPGSRYSIFVGWTANDFRRDVGELSQSLTERCQDAPAIGGPGFAAGVQCVLLELIP